MAGDLITADGQVEWRGVLLGSGTAHRTVDVKGWYDLPDMRGNDVLFSGRHGGYQGQSLAATRQITWNFKSKVAFAGFAAAVNQLRRITTPIENPVEEPLVIQLDGLALRCMARVKKRGIPTDGHYALGYTNGAIVWEATDSRLYSATETVYSTPLATSSTGGLDFGSGGLDFGSGGLDFGGGQQGGVITAANNGHAATWPIIEIDGPITGPGIIFADTGRRLLFDGSWTVLAGQTIVIDTYFKTAQIAGVAVSQRLQVRQWTPLLPIGDRPAGNKVLFTSAVYDPAPRMRVRVRDAYI